MKDQPAERRQIAERLTAAEVRIEGLATAAQVSRLEASVREWRDANAQQHKEIAERLFGSAPNSIQSQISTIEERAFGDSPVSLRSRVTEVEKGDAVKTGKVALFVSLCSGAGVFLATKWRDVAAFFGIHLAK